MEPFGTLKRAGEDCSVYRVYELFPPFLLSILSLFVSLVHIFNCISSSFFFIYFQSAQR